MRRFALLAFVSALAALFTHAPARAQLYPQPDRVGIYFDTAATTNWLASAPYQGATAYLILTNPSGTGYGIDAFECRINLPTNALRLNTVLPPGAINVGTFPEMYVAWPAPLPPSAVVVLASIGFLSTNTSPGNWTLTPTQSTPTVPGAMVYNMPHAQESRIYVMQPSHVPTAVINPDLSFVVDAQPDEARPAWHLSGPSGYQCSARGDTTLSGIPFGSYTITWEATGVWAPPAPGTATRTHDQWSGACVFSGAYQQRAQVVIAARPAGLAAPWILMGPDGFWLQGAGDRIFAGIAPGTYTVVWTPLAGWQSPDPNLATLAVAVGGTITFDRLYHTASAVPGGDDAVVSAPRLLPARPNPFNPRTTLRFELPAAAHARLEIFDLAGRRIRTLVSTSLSAGPHEVTWDGTDARGCAAPSGNYVARLTAGMEVRSVGMQLLR
jgi:hypothetical protein